jgi:aminoglycoside phosphotransferase family enzyme
MSSELGIFTPENSNSATGTAEYVHFLGSPDAYGGEFHDVEIRETSKSWVFLTPTEVYKLKKPIRNHFQDLFSLEARASNTLMEIALNRRLAPDVYLGAVPLRRDQDGALALGGEGVVVDWLVHMRRLPADCMLDEMIRNGHASAERIGHQVSAVAHQLTEFYRRAPITALAPAAYVALFEEEHERNRAVILNDKFQLDRSWLEGLLANFEEAIAVNRAALEDRVRHHKVVEGHGDLRPEHVCLVEPPVVIDCLEFSERLRLVDPFDEIVFLGMECHALGAQWIQNALIETCAAGLSDCPPKRLLCFYEAYRTLLRARQSLAHLLTPQPREPSKWLPKGRIYLRIAERALLTQASRANR